MFHGRRAAASGRELRFFLADFLIGADAIELFFADQRTHFRFALERRAKANFLGLGAHRFHKFRIDGLLYEDAAPRGTHFSLIDEDAEERAINRGFEIRIREKYIWRFTAQF